MKLFIDDTRNLTATDKDQYNIARNFNEVKRAMFTRPTFIDMDYSMGFDEPTGLDILKWFKKEGYDKFIEHINIHSSHPYGRNEMKKYIQKNFKDIRITMNQA